MSVFMIDKQKRPLMTCSEKRARKPLASGSAGVHRLIPFSIRIVDLYVNECAFQPVSIKLDPGSKTTGIALVGVVETVDLETGGQFRSSYQQPGGTDLSRSPNKRKFDLAQPKTQP